MGALYIQAHKIICSDLIFVHASHGKARCFGFKYRNKEIIYLY